MSEHYVGIFYKIALIAFVICKFHAPAVRERLRQHVAESREELMHDCLLVGENIYRVEVMDNHVAVCFKNQ